MRVSFCKFYLCSIDIEIPKVQLQSQKNILIGLCYRAHHVSINSFLDELQHLLENLLKLNVLIYLIGDFNINILRSHTGINKTVIEFSNRLPSYLFYPLITRYKIQDTRCFISGTKPIVKTC